MAAAAADVASVSCHGELPLGRSFWISSAAAPAMAMSVKEIETRLPLKKHPIPG